VQCDDVALVITASSVLQSATLTAVIDLLTCGLFPADVCCLRLQIWKAVADMLNQQPRTADKGWFSSLVVCRAANNSPSKGHACAFVDLFGDSVMGCDAGSQDVLCTVLLNVGIPSPSFQHGVQALGNVTWTRRSYRGLVGRREGRTTWKTKDNIKMNF
jgi:hypothetical protein